MGCQILYSFYKFFIDVLLLNKFVPIVKLIEHPLRAVGRTSWKPEDL